MSIANKLTYLNTTKGKIKDSINNLGGSIDSNTTFRDYATQLDNIYSRLPKVSGTGSNITLTPTLKGRLGSVLKGDTYQQTYSGKNLFDNAKPNVYFNSSKVFQINVATASTTDYIQANEGDIFTISCQNSSTGIVIASFNENYECLTRSATSGTTLTYTCPANTKYIIGSNYVYNNNPTQLEQGSSATSYEPYVGGQASPNPDYPQDIQCVEGIQNISVYGKNLFNKDTITSGYLIEPSRGTESANESYGCSDYIPVKANTQYTRVYCNNWYGAFYDENKNYVEAIQNQNVITPSVDGYVRISFLLTNTDTVQLEKGSTSTTYQAYQSQTQEVNLGNIKLYSGDKITGTPDNWSIVRNNGVIDSYSGETITTDYVSTTGGLDTGATIVYELNTPTTTPITDTYLISQLNALYNAKSYNGQTNISVSGNLPMILDVSALKDEI